MKYMDKISANFDNPGHPVFNSSELDVLQVGKKYKKRLVHLLLSKGRIIRITRGVYTFHKNAEVVGFAFRPFYYGLEDALSIRGISEQGTNPLVITPRNVRQGVRAFDGANYVVKRIPQSLFFGYGMVKRGAFWIPVSDVEKTVIDMLYFNDAIRDELWPGILKEVDTKRFEGYLQRYDPKFRHVAMDFLSEMRKSRHRRKP